MNKFGFEKKYIVYSVYLLFVICIAITFEKILGNITPLFSNINIFANTVIAILSPFLYGFFIAYILNSFLKFIEEKIFGKIAFLNKFPKHKRLLSVTTTFVIMFGFLAFTIAYLIPEISANIEPVFNLVNESLPKYIEVLTNPINDYFEKSIPLEQVLKEINKTLSTDFSFKDILSSLNVLPDMLNKIIGVTLNLVLGVMVAFYALCDKESFVISTKKIICALFRKNNADKIIFFGKEANNVFERYIIGKSLDSLIIAIIFFIGGLFLKLPFLSFTSLIIGVTNMIPYFGPLIGGVPVVLIILLNNLAQKNSPSQALWAAVFITVLQQIDGIIISPKILGDSTGLSPIEVILSILVGGAVFGVLGMFIGVPIFALAKVFIIRFIDKKYTEKINQESSGGI